jgi:PAS domain S-box-containing protein
MLPATPKQNHLLGELSAEDYARLLPDLEPVTLDRGQVLCESGQPLAYVYFPTTCIVSLVAIAADGGSAGLAVTGNEGLVGIVALLGGEAAAYRALVHSPGEACRMRADLAQWELDQRGGLLPLALRYAQVLMTQMAQTALCNRLHTVDQQLGRWLLLTLDRLAGNVIEMTQAQIANLLGVRREAVAEAAAKLQAAGLIRYSRGRIVVVDRPGLEGRACECYAVINKDCARLHRLLPAGPKRQRIRPNPTSVRKRAEERFRQSQFNVPNAPQDKDRLVEELKVHLIVMEMQHEELAQSYAEADVLRDRYADIYDFSPVAYVTVDALGTIRQINLAGAILLGVKRSRIRRCHFAESVGANSLAAFHRFLEAVLGGHSRCQCEIELSATAHRPAATVAIEGIADEDGRECRMVLVDVTTQRHSERALRERERYLRTLIDNMPDLLLVLDEAGLVTDFHLPAHRAPAGLRQDAIIGRHYGAVMPRDVADTLSVVMAEVRTDNRQRRVAATTQWLGRALGLDATVSRILDDELRPQGYLCVARDVTEELAARARASLLNLALEAVGNGVVITDTQGRIQWVNPAFEALTGYPSEEAIDRRPADLIRSDRQDKAYYEAMWQTILAGGVWRGELINRRKDGAEYHAELTIAPVRDEAGTIRHFVGIQADIGHRKKLEEELRTLARRTPLAALPGPTGE